VLRAVAVISLLALVVAACGETESRRGGGLVAQELAIRADGAIAGPLGVYAVEGGHVQGVDPTTGKASGQPIELHALGTRMVVDDQGAIWFVDREQPRATRVTPDGVVTQLAMPEGDHPVAIAVTNGTAWVSSITPNRIFPFAPDGNRGEPVETPCAVVRLVGAEGSVWGACDKGVVRLDAASRQITLIDTGGEPGDLAVTTPAIWALVSDRLVAIDPRTGVAAGSFPAPADANSITGTKGALWVASTPQGGKPEQITRHDAADMALLAGPVDVPGSTTDVPARVGSMAAFGDDLWLAASYYGAPLVVIRQGA
jgi:streptogramin lyase